MRGRGSLRVRRRAAAAVARPCASCGRSYVCLRRSPAEEIGLCLRCFERKLRFPGLCQRP